MSREWVRFVGALEAKGLSFDDVQYASDVQAVVRAAGIADALSIAVVETEWRRRLSLQQGGGKHRHNNTSSYNYSRAAAATSTPATQPPILAVMSSNNNNNNNNSSTTTTTGAPATAAPSSPSRRSEKRRSTSLVDTTDAVTGSNNSNNNNTATAAPLYVERSQLHSLPEELQDVVVTNDVLAAALGCSGTLLTLQTNNNNNNSGGGGGTTATAPSLSLLSSSLLHNNNNSADSSRRGSAGGFVIAADVPASLRGLCAMVLPVADAFVALRAVERAENGGGSLVAMALAEAVTEVCTSYAAHVARLQHSCRARAMPLLGVVADILRAGHHLVRLRQLLPLELLVQGSDKHRKGNTLLTTTTAATTTTAMATSSVDEVRAALVGPRLLNHLYEQSRRCRGSREDDALLTLLLRRALVPYLHMLRRWMNDGVVADAMCEFFVVDATATATTRTTTMTSSRLQQQQQQQPPLLPTMAAVERCRRLCGALFTDAVYADNNGNGNNMGSYAVTMAVTTAAAEPSSSSSSSAAAATMSHACRRRGRDGALVACMTPSQQQAIAFARRFALHTVAVPTFLTTQRRSVKMIYYAGKYRCLLRECQQHMRTDEGRGGAAAATATATATTTTRSHSSSGGGDAARRHRQPSSPHHDHDGDDEEQQQHTSHKDKKSNDDKDNNDDDKDDGDDEKDDVQRALHVWCGVDALHNAIHASYARASRAVMRLLHSRRVDLCGYLTTLKVFFLQSRGDWLNEFLDSATAPLSRAAAQVRVHSLRVLLHAAVARCNVTDAHHDCITCSFASTTLPRYVRRTHAAARRARALAPGRRPGNNEDNDEDGEDGDGSRAARTAMMSATVADDDDDDENATTANAAAAHTLLVDATAMDARDGDEDDDEDDDDEDADRRDYETLPCVELLQLEADIPWPLTLVLDAALLRRLNAVFRLLLWLRRCERELCLLWRSSDVLAQFSVAYGLKHHLTHVLRQYQFYAAHFVVAPAWGRLMTRVHAACDVFALTRALEAFCSDVEAGLLLASASRFRSLASILDLTERFCAMSRHTYDGSSNNNNTAGGSRSSSRRRQQGGSVSHSISRHGPCASNGSSNNNNNNVSTESRSSSSGGGGGGAAALTLPLIEATLHAIEDDLLRALSELASPVGHDYAQLLPLLTWLDYSGYYGRNNIFHVQHATATTTAA